jgi:hypothetical protein
MMMQREQKPVALAGMSNWTLAFVCLSGAAGWGLLAVVIWWAVSQ